MHDVDGRRDVDIERIHWRRPKPLCPPHLITLQFLAKILRTKTATTSGSLQLCPEIIDCARIYLILFWTCQ